MVPSSVGEKVSDPHQGGGGRVGNIYTVTQDTHRVAMIPDMVPEVWIGVSAP